MAYAHHPHFLPHEWLELHPKLVAGFNRYGLPLVLGILLATTALLVGMTGPALHMPLEDSESAVMTTDELFVPTGMTGYLPLSLNE